MGELGFNKFFGALLATLLLILGLNEVSNMVFSSGGGHHGEHHYDSQNEGAADKFHGYRIEIAEATSGGAEEEEDVFDLGLMLASADVAAGERAMRQCAQCHSWDEGGAAGTGPNLHGIMSADIAAKPGFAYSGALSGVEGNWTYAAMNDWLTNPGAFARGNKMSFAGLRSPRKDAERVNIIAYLASVSPNAEAFPAPLVTEASAEEAIEGDIVEAIVEGTEATNGENPETPAEVSPETSLEDSVTDPEPGLIDQLVDSAEETGTDALETASDAAVEVIEEVVDTAQDAIPAEQ